MANATVEKTCPKCKTTKPVTRFYCNKSQSDGLSYACKECTNAWNLALRHAPIPTVHGRIKPTLKILKRLFSNIVISTVNFYKDVPCWEWQLLRNEENYGITSYRSKNTIAHRFFYELFVGIIPKELEIDHLCRVRYCVNPIHLEAVTSIVNFRRGNGDYSKKTHCKYGHEYTPENTYRMKTGRSCRQCQCRYMRESRQRIKNLHK